MRYLPLIAVALTGCAGFSETATTPEGQQAIDTIAREAANTAVSAISGNWTAAITSAATAGAAVLGLVRLWRGSTTNRKGTAPVTPSK